MKRVILIIILILLLAAGIGAWIFLGSATGFAAAKEQLYISSRAATKKAVIDSLVANKIITNETAFEFLANRFNYWTNIKPGKYEFRKGTSLLTIVRTLRNGSQTPVDLVITKIRTKEDLARLVGKRFETDSAEMIAFLNSTDSLSKFGTEPEYSLWNVLPNTYTYFWNSSASKIYQKLYDESRKFWNEERKKKASALGLSPLQVYTLASIIEEETTNHSEKDTIASVYLNRLRTGMPLQADPTLKFAVKDFSIKRIYGDILNVESPYNTYRNRGLPPGPICTPSQRTIDAVLDPADTKFLYFVANRELNGHLFSEDYEGHLKKRAGYLEQDKQRREGNSKTPSR